MLPLDRDALLAAQNAALQHFGVRLELRGARAFPSLQPVAPAG
jgi:hypothetical protein